MRYLGLDLGTKTLGIAISDPTGLIASSYQTLRHDNNIESLMKPLLTIIQKEKVEALVLGYPKNMNNTLGPRVEETCKFKEKIEKISGLPVFLMDERLSTVSAEKTLLLNHTSRKKRKEKIDAVAATIILQSYLNWKGR